MAFIESERNLNLLFVCMGNICRSPAGEGILKSKLAKLGLEEKVNVDSAGIIGFHTDELPDIRMRKHAAQRGYTLNSKARKFVMEDFETFDHIFVMDTANYRDITKLDPEKQFLNKLHRATDFCTYKQVNEVPDPYYGGEKGFENVLDILEDACTGIIKRIILEKDEKSG